MAEVDTSAQHDSAGDSQTRHKQHHHKSHKPQELSHRMKRHFKHPEHHKHVSKRQPKHEYDADLTDEERQIFSKFYEEIKAREDISSELKKRRIVLMFLRGKKFVPERALLVMKNFMKVREEVGNLSIADVANYLATGVFYSIPDAVDKDGRKVYIVQARYVPSNEAKMERAHAMAYLLERDMNSPKLQRDGITTVIDMRKAPFIQNQDPQRQLSKMLQDSYPIRIGSVLIIEPPWFFKILIGAMKFFIKAKVLQRMKVVKLEDLPQHIDKQFLLPDMGGHSTYSQADWLMEQYEHEGIEPSEEVAANIQKLRDRAQAAKLRADGKS
eukprot:TRINITY_DN10469_c0_g1_i1.p1 TRINITY_DN10469_c0_g1~~TRINITY_DN10469_c0_g1_i1.p1  ORF type:complete len:345 (-),score=90.15 TRINITY_DN10469_c0_g1_i1:5-985(-)